jgi:thioredoxin 1
VQVYGLPALIVFKDGQEVEGSHKEGAITKALLQKYIKQYAVTSVAA